MEKTVRIRRTADEAKNVILEAATARLSSDGVKGLNIKEIAADSGMNHATILHHFGSADEMRAALLLRLTTALIEDMSEILRSSADERQIVTQLFRMMGETGHIRLLAWRVMEGQDIPDLAAKRLLMDTIVQGVSERLHQDDRNARRMIAYVVSTAVGWSMCGDSFAQILGMSEEEQGDFPQWVSQHLPR